MYEIDLCNLSKVLIINYLDEVCTTNINYQEGKLYD